MGEILNKALHQGCLTMAHYFNLGHAFKKRYEITHGQQDLDNAITTYKHGLAHCPGTAEQQAQLLDALGLALFAKYHWLGVLDYLEESVVYHSKAVRLGQTSNPIVPVYQMNLGSALTTRYEQLGNMDDLENAISHHEQALYLHPVGHSNRSSSLNNLGNVLYIKYKQLGEMEDLENAISHHEEALDLHPAGHPSKYMSLNGLASALQARYEQLGAIGDLEKAINCYKDALDSCPSGHRPGSLNNLASALHTRYEQLGEIGDLEKVINYYEQALDLYQIGHPKRSVSLSNLANALWTRYKHFGEMGNLEKAISHHEQALALCPVGHPSRAGSLNNLGGTLQTRYLCLGEMGDLKKAIGHFQQAVELCSVGHPDKYRYLSNLGGALKAKYEQLGKTGDLEKAINYYEAALDLCPLGNPDHPMVLNVLGSALRVRYGNLGETEDLEKAIRHFENALGLFQDGHPARSQSLNNLGSALFNRYDQLGEIEDLEKTISCYEQTLNSFPDGHPHRPVSLQSLGFALFRRYEQLKKIEDLEKAISHHEQVLNLCPVGHPNRAGSLSNLADALTAKYKWLRDMRDLEKAISHYEETLNLHPSGHPNRCVSLSNLGNALKTRHEELGAMVDLVKAIGHLQQAVELCPIGHPGRSAYLNSLGSIHCFVYQRSGSTLYLSQAIGCYRQAAYATSHLPHMLRGAKEWAFLAHTHELSSGTSAYSLAMNLLHQHIALLPSLTSQQKLVQKSSFLSLDAAAWAIETGTLDMAVQYLEQGRSILWAKIQGYKQPLKDISEIAPHLSREFQEVSHMLQYNATSGETDISLHGSQYKRWTTLVEQIRALDGLSNFLQATPFETLKEASAEGPVIMVNISQFRSDAIILVVDSPPILVPLQDAALHMLKGLVDQLLKVTATSGSSKITYNILHTLWNTIVQPVVAQLEQLQVPEKSHIWWCPTSYLCALPLHAAGLYQQGTKNLPDLYISSYTPTLTSLIKARSNISKHKSDLSLLLVSQPDDTIPQVFEEAKVINRVKAQVSSLSGHYMNKEGILASLKSHPWVHFACHGHLEAQPFHSWFQLYNKEHLTVLDLAGAQLPNAEFAFLSACHSAAGSVHGTPDESIHLAGALQVSGFRSVIGTLWAMVDDDGPPLADAFYNEIIDELGNVDVRDAAKALNIATRTLRRKKVPVERWINFIHLGA